MFARRSGGASTRTAARMWPRSVLCGGMAPSGSRRALARGRAATSPAVPGARSRCRSATRTSSSRGMLRG